MPNHESLDKLRQRFEADTNLPLYADREKNKYLPVFGEGNEEAKVVLIGEAPGKKEAETGKPFVGAAGKKLDEYLKLAELEREEIYITSVLKDRPPKNRDPQSPEVKAYKPYLIDQIKIIKPLYIVTLGRFALDALGKFIPRPSGKVLSLSQVHGELLEMNLQSLRINVVPMYHPASTLYNPDTSTSLINDFTNLGILLKNAELD